MVTAINATVVIGVTLVYSALAAPNVNTGESAIEIAKEFLFEKRSTYLYDGIPAQISSGSLVNLGDRGWDVTLLFTSRTAGYGDRSEKMTAQVLTNRTMHVVVEPDG
jgi:hypothetical protein